MIVYNKSYVEGQTKPKNLGERTFVSMSITFDFLQLMLCIEGYTMPMLWHVVFPVFIQEFAVLAKGFIAEVEPTFLGGGTEGLGFQGGWLGGLWCGRPYGVLPFCEELIHLQLFVS